MRTVLDEIIKEDDVSPLHIGKKCQCNACRLKMDSMPDFEFLLDESSVDEGSYSCEPGKFPRDYFYVTRWQGRYTTSGRKKLPKDNDVKILGRGRKKVLFPEIEKALFLYKKKSIQAGDPNFSTKIPDNIGQIYPELDLTVDLFYNNNNELTAEQIQKSLYRHIRENRIPEYVGCKKGFVIMYDVGINEYQKIENQFNASLTDLFNQTGIKLPLENNKENMSKFFFLVYFVFPDQLEQVINEKENKKFVLWIRDASNNLDDIIPLKKMPNPENTRTGNKVNRDNETQWKEEKNELKCILTKTLNYLQYNAPFEDRIHSVIPLTDGETVKSIKEEPDVNPNALALNDDIVPRIGIILSELGY